MKIIKFKKNNSTSYGKLVNDKVYAFSTFPWIDQKLNGEVLNLRDLSLLAPGDPTKIIGLAVNYEGSSGSQKNMLEPLIFLKPHSSLIGPSEKIISPFKDINIWGECELAIIVSNRLKNATKKEASEAIFGYSVANDITAENLHDWDHHLLRSKGCDTFCVLGPWIDTDFKPNDQEIIGYHNDEVLRKGFLNERVFKEPDILVELSKWITIEPGDIILTGAPNRVKKRQFFSQNDSYSCEIDGLGKIKNFFLVTDE